jgi:hypothetical protein
MKIMEFSFYIDSLDKKVQDHDYFDYSINLNSINSIDSYIVYTDYFDTNSNQTISYNSSSGNS